MARGDLKQRLTERWEKLGQGPEVETRGGDTRGGKEGMEGMEGGKKKKNVAATEAHAAAVVDDANEDEKENLEYRELWCSGRKKDEEPTISEETSLGSALVELKERAREALEDGEPEVAEDLYTNGLKLLSHERERGGEEEEEEEGKQEKENHRSSSVGAAAILYSNRAYARARQQRWLESIADACASLELKPNWAKPYYRLAQAKSGLGDYRGAIAACRQGQKVLDDAGSRLGDFVALMDDISNAAFIHGSLAGFDGRVLHVRSAGEEAWLGREAPENPLIDEEPEERSRLVGSDGEGDDGDVDVDEGTKAAMVAKKKSEMTESGRGILSFRSIKSAVDEAKDGDRILLLRGIHNTGGATIFVDKRILIRSEGTLEETTIDHRGNSPIFRVTRNAILQNIDIDMTGFRESLYIYGGPKVSPVIEHCRFRCSGDDAINVAGQANPVVRQCHVVSCKKVGLRLYERARGEYIDLKISSCSEQAVKLMEQSMGKFYNCSFDGNREEAVVVMDDAEACLRECCIEENEGPGVDLSGRGKLLAEKCKIRANVGGIWLWDTSKAVISQCSLEGGKSHVILADAECLPSVTSSTIEGMVQATDEAWEGICRESNTFRGPMKSVELPPEDGPFKFEPVWYQRKQ